MAAPRIVLVIPDISGALTLYFIVVFWMLRTVFLPWDLLPKSVIDQSNGCLASIARLILYGIGAHASGKERIFGYFSKVAPSETKWRAVKSGVGIKTFMGFPGRDMRMIRGQKSHPQNHLQPVINAIDQPSRASSLNEKPPLVGHPVIIFRTKGLILIWVGKDLG